MVAKTTPGPDPAYKQVYQNPQVQEAVNFMKNELPTLVRTNPELAAAEYEKHFNSLNQLEEWDVLFLVGHFYAVSNDAKTALRYFPLLAEHPQLGEDARRMINLLLYQRTVSNLLSEDKEAAKLFLQDVLNVFDTGKYYPTYLYLWADLVSSSERSSEIEAYVNNYKANRNWVETQFKPRKNAIINRMESINTAPYYEAPTESGYTALATIVDGIKADLETLMGEARTIKGLVLMDALEQIHKDEMRLLENYKKSLHFYLVVPEVSINAMLDPDSPLQDNPYFDRYKEGAYYLTQVRIYQTLLGKTIASMDKIFEIKYQMYVNEDPSVMGKDFSDMELKRLLDIEKNIKMYQALIDEYELVMATPEYKAQTALDLSGQVKEYKEKQQDLKIRKNRYLSVRKHSSDFEEQLFMEFLNEYYALNEEYDDWNVTMNMVESDMLANIMMRYPEEMKLLALKNKDELKDQQAYGALDAQLSMITANLDYLALQNRYRNLNYRDAQRKADANLTLAESTSQYEEIIAQKKNLLNDYVAFMEVNPDFRALEQPSDLVEPSDSLLISPADVYYNMAELQWSTDLDNPDKALAYYRKVLEADPDFYLKDHALYNVAYFSSEINRETKERYIDDWRTLNPNQQRGIEQRLTEADFAEAIENYNRIITEQPNSKLFDESAYRLANLYFLIGTDAERPIEWYAKANALFDQLAAKEGSPYRYEAVFQRGFVNMNISDESSLNAALVDFASILNAVDNNQISPPETAQDLKNNSLDQIAYCLVALDGSDFTGQSRGLEALSMVLADYQDEIAMARILDKASENKKDMRLTRQSIDFLELRLQKTPSALTNPSLVDSVLVLYYANDITLRPGENRDQIRRDKYRWMVENYGKDSRWYNANVKEKDPADPVLAAQLASVRNAYRQAQIVYYEAVRTQLTEEAFQAYLDHTGKFSAYEELFQPAVYTAYTDHLKRYNATPEAYDAEYASWKLNAEREELILLGNLADTRQTGEAYKMIYDRLLAYNEQHLVPADPEYFDKEELAYSYALKRDQLLKPQLQGAELDSLYVFYKDSTLRFVNALMNAGTEARIRQARQLNLDLANTEFNDGRYKEAEARYLSLLENDPSLNSDRKYEIYYNLAFIAESDESYPAYERYKRAEDYARQAMAFTADSARLANADRMVKLQIQNSYNAAKEGNDYTAAASQFGRMADEFPFDRYPAEHVNYKRLQAEQYELAKDYGKLIDTYMYLAGKEDAEDVDAVYGLYYLSWTVADSLMQSPERATAIRDEFMSKYPTSNQAYRLIALDIEKKALDPATKIQAAEEYIALSEQVRNGQIDAGDVKPENIYMQAYNIYNEDQASAKRLEVLDEFTRRYPNHPDVTGMYRTIASGYYVLGDTLRFESYAKQLFERDKGEFDLYQGVAVKRLSRILVEYDNAYLNKDWDLAFAKRDEFKAEEAKYRKEGLPLNTEEQYKSFAAAEAEYKEIQANLAFLRNFDNQIKALENSAFLAKAPNEQFWVGNKTSFKNTLLGGKQKLLPSFRTALNAEVTKVERLISPANQLKLDTPRIVRALALEARIYEYGIGIITSQINRFFEVANEIRPYKDDATVQANIWGQINNDFIYPIEDAANGIYASIFSTFHMAGYEDQYTQQAVAKLSERNILPEFQKQEFPLGNGWTLNWIDEAGNSTPATPVIGSITSPKGQVLGNLQIPPLTTLQAEIKINSTVAPELVYLQMVYPYNPEAMVNGKEVQFAGFAVDSLDVKQPMTARFGYRFSGAEWNDKENTIRLLFPNRYQENIQVRATLQAYYSKAKLEEARPRETLKFSSSPAWNVMILNPETQEENAMPALAAESFGIPMEAVNGFADTQAQPIWAAETAETPQNLVVFETSFDLDGQPVSAAMEFIAPENASVFVNGTLVAEDLMLDAEFEPLSVYSTIVDLPLDALRQGRNTVRIEVRNQTAYRGMLAEIKIDKYAKE